MFFLTEHSGRVHYLRLRDRGFEPHWCHCVVSLSKTLLSFTSTGSTQEDPSQHNSKIVDWDVKNQTKQTDHVFCGIELFLPNVFV